MSYHALHCVETIWVLSGLTIQMQYTICALPCPFNQVSLMSPSIVCTPPIGQKMSYNEIQNKSKTARWDFLNQVQTCLKHDATKSNYCITIFNQAWAGLGWIGLDWQFFFSKSSCYKGTLGTAILAVKKLK